MRPLIDDDRQATIASTKESFAQTHLRTSCSANLSLHPLSLPYSPSWDVSSHRLRRCSSMSASSSRVSDERLARLRARLAITELRLPLFPSHSFSPTLLRRRRLPPSRRDPLGPHARHLHPPRGHLRHSCRRLVLLPSALRPAAGSRHVRLLKRNHKGCRRQQGPQQDGNQPGGQSQTA